MMERTVSAEALDSLCVDDPTARRSRRDLRRLHRAMGTRAILVRALKDITASGAKRPLRVLELGAGDGSLMLGVAQALAPGWPSVELTLLDRQTLLERETISRYEALGWRAVPEVADVFDWAANANSTRQLGRATPHWDLIVANLFLHHFEGAQLTALLRAMAVNADQVFLCEPRRAWLALAGSHLVGAIGANAVTREDAVLSVRAGFCQREITGLWPVLGGYWQLQEYPGGLFSHCFRAQRVAASA